MQFKENKSDIAVLENPESQEAQNEEPLEEFTPQPETIADHETNIRNAQARLKELRQELDSPSVRQEIGNVSRTLVSNEDAKRKKIKQYADDSLNRAGDPGRIRSPSSYDRPGLPKQTLGSRVRGWFGF